MLFCRFVYVIGIVYIRQKVNVFFQRVLINGRIFEVKMTQFLGNFYVFLWKKPIPTVRFFLHVKNKLKSNLLANHRPNWLLWMEVAMWNWFEVHSSRKFPRLLSCKISCIPKMTKHKIRYLKKNLAKSFKFALEFNVRTIDHAYSWTLRKHDVNINFGFVINFARQINDKWTNCIFSYDKMNIKVIFDWKKHKKKFNANSHFAHFQ